MWSSALQACFAFPSVLLTSQLDSGTQGMHVSELFRTQLPEVKVQADRPAPQWPIRREAVALFFTSYVPPSLYDDNSANVAIKV